MTRVWREAREREKYNTAWIVATLYNAHFEAQSVPWTPEDLLGTGDRQKRVRESVAAKMRARFESERGEVPLWAIEAHENRKRKPN